MPKIMDLLRYKVYLFITMRKIDILRIVVFLRASLLF